MSDQQVLVNFAGNTRDPVSAPRTAMAQTLAWLLAAKPDFGMSPCEAASPRTCTSGSVVDERSAAFTGAQRPSVTPAISAMRPAFCAGITLQTSTLSTIP